MRWAFVIQLASDSNPSQRQFSGRVEEVDSARELRFRSTDELLTFLGDCCTSGHPDNPDNPDIPAITSDVIDTTITRHVQGDACSKE
jgi:hypothetical protein